MKKFKHEKGFVVEVASDNPPKNCVEISDAEYVYYLKRITTLEAEEAASDEIVRKERAQVASALGEVYGKAGVKTAEGLLLILAEKVLGLKGDKQPSNEGKGP